jgi:hypothetical protein
MIIHRKISPGKPGTKQLLKKYGSSLICLRYRYDTDSKLMTKSIELAIEQRPWEPHKYKIPPNKIVHIKVDYNEIYTRKLVKSAGGHWDRDKKAWNLA